MEGKEIKERTRQFRRCETVDVIDWVDFEIVETTMRGFRVRYRELVDKEDPAAVEYPPTT